MRSQPVDEIQALARALVVGVVQATAHCGDSEVARSLRRTAVRIGLELASQRAAHPVRGWWSEDASRRIVALGCLLEAATTHGDLQGEEAISLASLQSRARAALTGAGQPHHGTKSTAT